MALATPISNTGNLVAIGTGSTSGANTTTLLTFAIPDGDTSVYEAWFAAKDPTVKVGLGYGRAFAVYRDGATARFLSGTPTPILTGEDDAAATVVVAISSTNIVLQGTGILARDYNWKVKLYEMVRI